MANEDKATRYHRLRRRASMARVALGGAFLFALVASGASAALRDWLGAATNGAFIVTLLTYVLAVVGSCQVLQLPLAFYQRVILDRRYGLSSDTPLRWLAVEIKEAGVTLVLAAASACFVTLVLSWRPDDWWVWSAAGSAGFLVAIAVAAPVLLAAFGEVKPFTRSPLSERLAAVAARAGARVTGVYEWHAGARSRRANAALAGIGPATRLLVSDALLAHCSDGEVEVVVAHEVGHHVHRDLWATLAVESVLVLAGCYVADVALARWSEAAGLMGKSDIAALPIIGLACAAAAIAGRPVGNAVSRAQERRADRFALELTGDGKALVSAVSRLAAHSLAESHPSRLTRVFFLTHPPASERIDAARAWLARGGRGTGEDGGNGFTRRNGETETHGGFDFS